MRAEDKKMLWRISATLLGAALPCILILKPGLMYGLLATGLLSGLAATKGESLRGSLTLMLDSWIVGLVVAMLGVFLLGAGLGAVPEVSFGKWLDLLAASVIAGMMFIVLREMPGTYVELLLKVLAWVTFAAIGLAMLDVLLDQPRLSMAIHGSDKFEGDYRLNFFSGALAVILPFVWARLLVKTREGEPFARKIAVPAAALSLLALIVCGGRAGWVGGGVAVLVFMFAAERYHRIVIHARHWFAVGLVVAIGLGVYALVHGPEFALQRMMVEPEGGRGLMSGRLDVWAAAWQNVGGGIQGWLIGDGLSSYRYLPGAVDMHPHCWVLQLLIETGIIGLLLYVMLIGLLMRRFWRFAHGNLYGVAAVASLSAFLVVSLANTSVFNMWWVTFMLFTCLLASRVGWAGVAQHKRKRGRVLSRRTLVGEK